MFSPTEKTVIDIIGRRKVTIAQISEELSRLEAHETFDLRNYVGNVVRRITKKCHHFNLNWTLEGVRDSSGRTVWREKK